MNIKILLSLFLTATFCAVDARYCMLHYSYNPQNHLQNEELRAIKKLMPKRIDQFISSIHDLTAEKSEKVKNLLARIQDLSYEDYVGLLCLGVKSEFWNTDCSLSLPEMAILFEPDLIDLVIEKGQQYLNEEQVHDLLGRWLVHICSFQAEDETAQKNKIRAIKSLIKAGADVNARSLYPLWLMFWQKKKHYSKKWYSLDRSDPSAPHWAWPFIPLVGAVATKDKQAVELLLNAQANTNRTISELYPMNALSVAAFNEDSDLTKYLLERGADPSRCFSSVHPRYCEFHDDPQNEELLAIKRLVPKSSFNHNLTAEKSEKVKNLLARIQDLPYDDYVGLLCFGIKYDAFKTDWSCALPEMAILFEPDLIDLVIEKGRKYLNEEQIHDLLGRWLVHICSFQAEDKSAQQNKIRAINSLIKAGADVNAESLYELHFMFSGQRAHYSWQWRYRLTDWSWVFTSLVGAVASKDKQAVELLLNAQANINHTINNYYHPTIIGDNYPSNALSVAVFDEDLDLTKYLLERGADPMRCKLDSWYSHGGQAYETVIELIIKSEANIDNCNFSRRSLDRIKSGRKQRKKNEGQSAIN